MWVRTLLVGLGFTCCAVAQEPPSFRAGTRLVEVNVVVRDANGPVTGLTKDDFSLFDKGKPREISVFAVNGGQNPDQRRVPVPGEVLNRPDASGSATVVLLDFLNSQWQDQYFARGQLARFVDSMGDSDRMALLALRKELIVLQNFTNGRDRGQLSQAVEHLPFEVDEGQLPTVVPTGYWRRVKKDVTDQALQAIVRHLAAMPGRRNLVWIASGFDYDARRRVLVSEKLTRMLTESNIALYFVGTTGVTAPTPTAQSPTFAGRGGRVNSGMSMLAPSMQFERNFDLQRFAVSTGGMGFANSNDVASLIAQAVHDTEMTYTLGFYPPEAALDGTTHPLKVRVARKGVEVRYRQVWYASAADKTPVPPADQAFEQLAKDPLDATAIALSAVVRRSGDPVKLAVDLSVNLPDLRLETEGERHRGAFDVAYQVGGDKGLRSRAFNLDLSEEEFRAAMGKPYAVSLSIPLDTAAAGPVRIIVRDRATGAAGSLWLPVKPQ